MPVPVALIVGVIVGVVITALAVVGVMRSKMIVSHRSSRSFDETCAAIERVVPAGDGWSFPLPSFDMHAKLAEKDQAPAGMRRNRLFFVCKPGVANRVLSDTPKIAAMMPCSWAVYELEDGSVWLATMNIGMMSKMFAGEVAAGMGEVAAADEKFLPEILGR
jgi:uncharacterized protein (DUF302 family)